MSTAKGTFPRGCPTDYHYPGMSYDNSTKNVVIWPTRAEQFTSTIRTPTPVVRNLMILLRRMRTMAKEPACRLRVAATAKEFSADFNIFQRMTILSC